MAKTSFGAKKLKMEGRGLSSCARQGKSELQLTIFGATYLLFKDEVSTIRKMEWIAEMPGMRGTQGQQIRRAWDGNKGETDLKTSTEKN